MLFPYKYVPHQMEKMQEFIDFIFHEVWCCAPGTQYSIDLFTPSEELHKIMDELYRRDLAGKLKDGAGKFFYQCVNEVFNDFKTLTHAEIEEYKAFFTANNMVEEVCSGSMTTAPAIYEALNPAKTALNDKIENFFKGLYSSGFFDLKFVKDIIGSNLGDYYLSFVQENKHCICPFCGLQPIDGEYDPTREAFDHYLPKSKYPFNSVNLKNLASSCHKCNSDNKRDKDPLHDKGNKRRKAFYPFSTKQPDISLSISVKKKNWNSLKPEDLSITIQSAEFHDETSTWKELFRIEQRYAARCCNQNGGIYWLNRVLNECQNYKLSAQDMLVAEIKSASDSPFIEANFIRKAFLEGCQHAGLFNEPAEES